MYMSTTQSRRPMTSCGSCCMRAWSCLRLQTRDAWWSSGAVCAIPGPAGTYPFSFSSYDVCGGAAAVTALPLIDDSGAQLGSVYVFRDYAQLLRVTVALGSAGPLVALYEQGSGEAGEAGDLGLVGRCPAQQRNTPAPEPAVRLPRYTPRYLRAPS